MARRKRDKQADDQADKQALEPDARVPPEAPEAPDTASATAEPSVAELPAGLADDLPLFARSYPDDPELRSLLQAFLDGNYARVREGAPALAARTDDPAVAAAAVDLRARLEPDPLALWMLGGMALLLLFLVVWFYSHRH